MIFDKEEDDRRRERLKNLYKDCKYYLIRYLKVNGRVRLTRVNRRPVTYQSCVNFRRFQSDKTNALYIIQEAK